MDKKTYTLAILQSEELLKEFGKGFKSRVCSIGGLNILIRHDPRMSKGQHFIYEVVKVNDGALDYVFDFGSDE